MGRHRGFVAEFGAVGTTRLQLSAVQGYESEAWTLTLTGPAFHGEVLLYRVAAKARYPRVGLSLGRHLLLLLGEPRSPCRTTTDQNVSARVDGLLDYGQDKDDQDEREPRMLHCPATHA